MYPLFLCKKRIKRGSPLKALRSKNSGCCFSFGYRLTSAFGKACRGERGGGCKPLFAKESDSKNKNISVESRRIEKVETFTENAQSQKDSAESLKDSSNSIESVESSNFKNIIDSHEVVPTSCNDDNILDSHKTQSDSRNDVFWGDSTQ